MARQHGGDLYDFANMDDNDIRDVVLEHLREYPNLGADWIDVDVNDGVVKLSGRVGSDSEIRVAQSVLDDVLGLDQIQNELIVDELHRVELPEGADEALTEQEETDGQLGRGGEEHSDTAEHLEEQLEEETFGTHDMGHAIRDGSTYVPPDRPVSDGYDSAEDH